MDREGKPRDAVSHSIHPGTYYPLRSAAGLLAMQSGQYESPLVKVHLSGCLSIL